MWVAIHMCMEAMLGISLYSYPYLKLAKCYVFLIISYVFSSTTKLENKRWNRFCLKGERGKGVVAQTMYMSKCKNDKIKNFKNCHLCEIPFFNLNSN
jgi:hypothetical protein